mmetsp:Transcript_21024/g.46148  ORF Transcript_21024/g.46148 Transcript_21024/m.46148 type:complete len:222 (-) Transcript_21024:649-1314(-)
MYEALVPSDTSTSMLAVPRRNALAAPLWKRHPTMNCTGVASIHLSSWLQGKPSTGACSSALMPGSRGSTMATRNRGRVNSRLRRSSRRQYASSPCTPAEEPSAEAPAAATTPSAPHSSAVNPASSTASMKWRGPVRFASKCTSASPVTTLTAARPTPGTLSSAASTDEEQAPHVMPPTLSTASCSGPASASTLTSNPASSTARTRSSTTAQLGSSEASASP